MCVIITSILLFILTQALSACSHMTVICSDFHPFPFSERPAGAMEGGKRREMGIVYSVRWSIVCKIDLS